MSLARFSLWIQARKKRRKAQQSRRKFAPAVSTTRAGDAAVSKSEDAAEVQLSSRQGPQAIQSGAPSRHPASLQAETLCGLGRVARSRGIDRRSRDGGRAARRRASVPLTPPAALLFVRADSRAVLAARACEELQTVASWALTDGHIGECRLTERRSKPPIWKPLADVALGAGYASARLRRFADRAPGKGTPAMKAQLTAPDSNPWTGTDTKNPLSCAPQLGNGA